MSDSTEVDFEFGFTHGDTQFITAREGRDEFQRHQDGSLTITVHHDADTAEELTIFTSHLAYRRMTKRTVTEPTQLEKDLELVDSK